MRIIDLLLQGKKTTNDTLGGYYFIEDNKIKFCNTFYSNDMWDEFYIKNNTMLEGGYEYQY